MSENLLGVRQSYRYALVLPRTQCGGGGPPEGRWRGRWHGQRWLSLPWCDFQESPHHHAEPVIGPATSGRTRWHGPPPPLRGGGRGSVRARSSHSSAPDAMALPTRGRESISVDRPLGRGVISDSQRGYAAASCVSTS